MNELGGLLASRERLRARLPRQALGHLENGRAAATISFGGTMIGAGVRSVTTVSLEPPRVLVALDSETRVAEGLETVRTFGLNLFGELAIAPGADFVPGAEMSLEGMTVVRGVGGNPLLADSVAQMECAVQDSATAGELSVFVADVTDIRAQPGARLDSWDGELRNFLASRDDATYRELRRAILERRLPIEADLEVDDIVDELGVERANVIYALNRLAHERLVTRVTAERYGITPVDEALIAAMLHARRILMVGITDTLICDLTDAEIESVRKAAEATRRPAGISDIGMENDRSVSVFKAFNEVVVGLSGSPVLLDAYRGLSVPTVMGRVLWRLDWSTLHDVLSEHAIEFADGLAARDRERAVAAIRAFNDSVHRYAVGVLRSTGGRL